jgi:uncharacterized protein
MQVINGEVLFSPSDLTQAADCEFSVLRRLDLKLGRILELDIPEDPLMMRAAGLGDTHEQRVLDEYHRTFGDGVVVIDRPTASDPDALQAGMEATLQAMADGADVVFQGVVFDGDFHGYADFLVRTPTGEYRVMDSKLARHAKVSALLQIAAYADVLRRNGAPIAEEGVVILGDMREEPFELDPVIPVYRDRRRRLAALVERHITSGRCADWEDPTVLACGRCPLCEQEAVERDDVLLVAGMRMTQRAKLRAAGVMTVAKLAVRSEPVPQISEKTLATLRAQAALQTRQPDVGTVDYDIFNPAALAAIPPPSPGDIFFDFEGDPMWQEPGSTAWGLEYLFGCADPVAGGAPAFTPFWAHDRHQERQALIDFLEYVRVRQRQWPDMHIYHYAAYEKTALLRLAAMPGVGEQQIDDLLRANVLVDLYPIVKASLRVSQPSYSLKKLEPLYVGDDLRTGGVTTAGDSVIEYAKYCDAVAAGDAGEAGRLLDEIADYNRYDCVSTLRLRDWLLARAVDYGIQPHGVMAVEESGTEAGPDEVAPTRDALAAYAQAAGDTPRSDEQTTAALMAAAIGFHQREEKPYWWGHFDRLSQPVDEWAESRDALIADEVEVVQDWHIPPKGKNQCRTLRITGGLMPGSSLEREKKCSLLYEFPHPPEMPDGGTGTRGWMGAAIVEMTVLADGRAAFTVDESAAKGLDPYPDLPMALAPSRPIPTESLRRAIADQAAATCRGLPAAATIPPPVRDLLLRQPPRLTPEGALPPVIDGDFVAAITSAATRLDGSTLAVQGPPGTGKTYVGARVIKNLVENHHWTVGVVSQGHSVVDNLLDQVVAAGLPPEKVGKKQRPKGCAWTALKDYGHAPFLASHPNGCVIGGTAWDFTSDKRVQREQLDLLVIDEAGQYSLANTVAVSVAAKRLMLLGDPQQLPQVSQGQHPEPVDESALGWLSEGMTLKPEFGYFLDKTWRMHPALTAPVSRLSYEGRLVAKEPETVQRSMRTTAGALVEPGLRALPVTHTGNDVSSVEESRAIVAATVEAMTWHWQSTDTLPSRPMTQADVLVVAPYNAQVQQIRHDLSAAGLSEVRVGTVDKFQGQEAAVVLVSMTASSRDDVPRGMEFLLSPNRLNVAISRGQWLAQVFYSPNLTDYLPTKPEGLAQLGRFIGLVDFTKGESSER